jgi:hypothetical protein
VGRYLWREDGSVVYNCCWPSPAQSFSSPSPTGLATMFYCLRFETSLFVASYDSQGYGRGVLPASTRDAPHACPVCSCYIASGRTAQGTSLPRIVFIVACVCVAAIPVYLAVATQRLPLLAPCHKIITIWHVNIWGIETSASNVGTKSVRWYLRSGWAFAC